MTNKNPSKKQIQKSERRIAKIRSGLIRLATSLTGTRQKLLAVKGKLRTPGQRQKYAALVKTQTALETATKSQAERYKVLESTMGKLKSMFSALAQGARQTAQRIWATAKSPVSWLSSKLRRRPRGLKDIDDLGVAPVVIWGVVVAAIAALSAAIGNLIGRASALEEQVQSLYEDVEYYEAQAYQAQAYRPPAQAPMPGYPPVPVSPYAPQRGAPAYDDYGYDDYGYDDYGYDDYGYDDYGYDDYFEEDWW